MKTRTSIALAVIAGFGLGTVSIHTLHAQAKPPVFTVIEIDVANPEVFAKEYSPKAQALTRKHGGKVLAASSKVMTLEGAPAKRIAILQWESMDKVKAWHSSAEYKENRKIGDKLAKFRYLVVEGLPQP